MTHRAQDKGGPPPLYPIHPDMLSDGNRFRYRYFPPLVLVEYGLDWPRYQATTSSRRPGEPSRETAAELLLQPYCEHSGPLEVAGIPPATLTPSISRIRVKSATTAVMDAAAHESALGEFPFAPVSNSTAQPASTPCTLTADTIFARLVEALIGAVLFVSFGLLEPAVQSHQRPFVHHRRDDRHCRFARRGWHGVLKSLE